VAKFTLRVKDIPNAPANSPGVTINARYKGFSEPDHDSPVQMIAAYFQKYLKDKFHADIITDSEEEL